MATGFVFVYLAIAAIAAPFVWFLWWGLDSFANRPASIHSAVRVAPPARPAYAAPHAVDVNLPVRPRMVTVFSTAGTELTTCEGPDAAGTCSRPLADGTVPCAGCLLALPRPIRGSFEWQIPAAYRTCLLGSYAVFRQEPATAAGVPA
jgi:hypothetical protein